ncbi:hemolysin XhlA [Edwardsiella tarda]|uniref:hemolysin XhlA n=1 Tax=Edwardsiella tarda TaxID=636 RepID=UPI003F659611
MGKVYKLDKGEPVANHLAYNYPSQGDGGGGDGGNTVLEKRIALLESDLASIKTDIAVMKSNYATKEDIASVKTELYQSISAQTKWLAATMLGVTGLALTIAKLIF